MSVSADFLVLIVALAAVSFACRSIGFVAMRFVKVTPKVSAALKAIPLSAMLGVVVPAAIEGGAAERLGLLVAAVTMKVTGNDLAAMAAGVCTAALVRVAGSV